MEKGKPRLCCHTDHEKEVEMVAHTLRRPASKTSRQTVAWNPQGKRKRGRPKKDIAQGRRGRNAEKRSLLSEGAGGESSVVHGPLGAND